MHVAVGAAALLMLIESESAAMDDEEALVLADGAAEVEEVA